ncbi:MAG TPA: PAS domain-containing protein [Caulobacteraceae bacterium]|jgi:hypothetical protein|nr:PAS domain-containing protein [Caulobacteraceae bacterium]
MMFKPNTERLLDYWRARRGEAAAPLRAQIDVTDFPALAPLVFLAEMQAGGDIRFRLAGEGVAALAGRPLRGESLLSLWAAEHRGRLSRLLASALAAAQPLVLESAARVEGRADGGEAGFEWLFTPLAGPCGALDRFLGLCQPEPGPAVRAGPLRIVAVNGVTDDARRARLRLAALDGRRIA